MTAGPVVAGPLELDFSGVVEIGRRNWLAVEFGVAGFADGRSALGSRAGSGLEQRTFGFGLRTKKRTEAEARLFLRNRLQLVVLAAVAAERRNGNSRLVLISSAVRADRLYDVLIARWFRLRWSGAVGGQPELLHKTREIARL